MSKKKNKTDELNLEAVTGSVTSQDPAAQEKPKDPAGATAGEGGDSRGGGKPVTGGNSNEDDGDSSSKTKVGIDMVPDMAVHFNRCWEEACKTLRRKIPRGEYLQYCYWPKGGKRWVQSQLKVTYKPEWLTDGGEGTEE